MDKKHYIIDNPVDDIHCNLSIADALKILREEDIGDKPIRLQEASRLSSGESKTSHKDKYVPNKLVKSASMFLRSSFYAASRSNSFNLLPTQITILRTKIPGFARQCAAMPAGRVGEWIAAFYELVDAAAAAHGVTRVESRGDCCVCVCGAAGAAPPAAGAAAVAAAADSAESQATRMLAFAADLHAKVASLSVDGSEVNAEGTVVRMGMATGEATFYVGGSRGDTSPITSVTGAAAAAAARMEALAAPGLARVHRSTADKWAAETREAPPATAPVEGADWAAERAAVYDCAARAFRPDAGALCSEPDAAGLLIPGGGLARAGRAGGGSFRAAGGVGSSGSAEF